MDEYWEENWKSHYAPPAPVKETFEDQILQVTAELEDDDHDKKDRKTLPEVPIEQVRQLKLGELIRQLKTEVTDFDIEPAFHDCGRWHGRPDCDEHYVQGVG